MVTNFQQSNTSSAHQWYSSALGSELVDVGIKSIQKLVPRRFYRVTLQVAGPPKLHYLSVFESEVRCRIASHHDSTKNRANIIADAEWLPFGESSIDLLVLFNAFEFSENPHDILREVSQCVTVDGIVAVVGFNPHSMLGIRHRFSGSNNSMLKNAKLYSVLRVRDWMSLLGFESLAGEYEFFRPPMEQAARLARMKRFEAAGARWWPGFGSVYVLVFRKKVLGVKVNDSLISRTLKKKRRILRPVTERSDFLQ